MSSFTFARCLVSILLFGFLFLDVLCAPPDTRSRFPPSRKILQNFTESEILAARAQLLKNQNQPAFSQSVPVNHGIATPSSAAAMQPNVTVATIEKAKALVADAQESVGAYNSFRMDNPRRNTQKSKAQGLSQSKRDEIPLPVLSPEVLSAASLLAEVDAWNKYHNGTLYKTYPTSSTTGPSNDKRTPPSSGGTYDFWMEGVDETFGTQPYGGSTAYKVWRNVLDYGAVGNGLADDTAAINAAIADGQRCGAGCNSSSVKGALVYFPTGYYLVSSPIISLYNTQLVGNAFSWPTILAAPQFMGLGVITSDVYIDGGGGAEWYIEQSNFYRQIRNFNIDLRNCTTPKVSAIHWQVAQATSLQNLAIYMDQSPTTTQYGLYTENGSGGWMSDLRFYGGWYGIYGGNQQYSVRGLTFSGVQTAVRLLWDWGWTWKEIIVNDCQVGISLFNEDETTPGAIDGTTAGSIYVLDSIFQNVDIAIWSVPNTGKPQGTSVITLDNIALDNVGVVVYFTDGDGPNINPNINIDFFTLGETEFDGDHFGDFGIIQNRSAALTSVRAPNGNGYPEQLWFARSKPQYEFQTYQTFVNMKTYAAGDGVTDDTAAINMMLQLCAQWNTESLITYILWFPAGSYVVTSTIYIPVNSYIVGQVWSQIVATGAAFEDMETPTVLVQVGSPGDVGSIEIQDMLFTSTGPLAGLVAMEWNVQAYEQGAAAMWDSHFRIGGALGSQLQVSECPKLSGTLNPNCIASSLMLHVTETASGYFENVWAWVADHDIDDPFNTQIDVYGARGILIESQGPTWLYGTASEHSVLYQYSIYGAVDVYMGMIQTESPYFQGSAGTQAPAPFVDSLLHFNGDPIFEDCGNATISCNNAWGLEVQNSNGVFISGAAFYSWFQNYNEACVNTQNCQEKIVSTWNSGGFWLYNLITIGIVEMVSPARNEFLPMLYSTNYTNALVYPWWSIISAYLELSEWTDINNIPIPVQNGWTAFGDSYAAGIGAGPIYDVQGSCRRAQGSYPNFMQSQFIGFNGGKIPNFQFRACSGAVSLDLIQDDGQVIPWNPVNSADIATLSILGNDVQFSALVKKCIFAVPYQGGSCEDQITTSQGLIASPNLDINWYNIIRFILERAVPQNPNVVIYITGYARFFDDTTGDPCNGNSLGMFPWNKPPLTMTLRQTLNDMADALNNRIQMIINAYNADLPRARLVFVNWDPQRVQAVQPAIFNGHRLCEPGVSEPTSGKAQDNVWFFYLGGSDNLAPGPAPTPPQVISSNSCNDTDPTQEAGGQAICDFLIYAAQNATFAASLNDVIAANGWDNTTAAVMPDGSVELTTKPTYYDHAFHPKSQGYNLISASVIAAMLFR